MRIRTASEDDIPAMAELLHELFSIEKDFVPNYAAQTKGLALLLKEGSARVFVAELQREVVGMCTVQVAVSTAAGCRIGKVEDVVVGLDHRGQGIGSALLKALEQWATEQGLARLQLQADTDNHSALGFYRRQGWAPTNLQGWIKQLPPTVYCPSSSLQQVV